MSESTERNALFKMLIGEPYLYGLPDNIKVMFMLCEKEYNKSMYACEALFKHKYPEYEKEFKSWLWVIYRYINKEDIDSTIKFLDDLFVPNTTRTHQTQNEIYLERSYDRLKYLKSEIRNDSDCLAINFAEEILQSATLAYGRPLISSLEDGGHCDIIFEWQDMFWMFKEDGSEIIVFFDDDHTRLTLSKTDLKEFINNYINIPSGMPSVGDRSEFNMDKRVDLRLGYSPLELQYRGRTS